MKRLSKLVIIILVLSQFSAVAFGMVDETQTNPFSDIKNHWAEQLILRYFDQEMINGYTDGTFRPDNEMKRSELITIINRYYGLKNKLQTNFDDVVGDEWYAKETAKAKYYEYIEDDKAYPNEVATRQDVIEMLYIIMDMEEQTSNSEGVELKDLEGLDEEIKEKIKMFSDLGYVQGYDDGTFRPNEKITRAQILAITERVLGYIVRNQDDLNNLPPDAKKVTIINPNIELDNVNIKGVLYISLGVNEGLKIRNSKIEGQLIISGGNQHSPIELENVQVEKVVLTKTKEKAGLEIKGSSQVGEIKTKSESQINISDETIVGQIRTQTTTDISLGSGTQVQELITERQTQVQTEEGSSIGVVQANSDTNIEGEGEIEEAYVCSSNVTIETRPEYVEVDETVGEVSIGGDDMSNNNDDCNSNNGDEQDHSGDDDRDNSPPRFTIKPAAITGENPGQIKITAKINESGNIYYLVLEEGSNAPTAFQIEKGEDNEGNKAIDSGSTKEYTSYIITLTPEQVYDIYFSAKDKSNNRSKVETVLSVKAKEPLNYEPRAENDEVEVEEDGSVLVDVLSNDIDEDGDIITIASYIQGKHGTVAQEGNSLRYTPKADYNGMDSFKYEISDGNLGTSTGTVHVIIDPVNDLPIANDDIVELEEDTSILIDVLQNDYDVDKDILEIKTFTQGKNGTVTQEVYGLRYTPDDNYNGTDSLTYTIIDNNGGQATGKVNLIINSLNNDLQANNDYEEVYEDSEVYIDVLANDTSEEGNLITIKDFTQGEYGEVTKINDKLKYTPKANYFGTDLFIYTITGINGGNDGATVTVEVYGLNDKPVASDDIVTIDENETVLINVLANDIDIDGDSLSVTSFTDGSHGTVSQEGDSLRYTPAANYNGADSFIYEINDGNGGVTTATVNITVNAVNDAPVAITDTASLNEDSTVLIDVLVNDTDIEGDTISITSFTQGSHGTVAQEGDSLRYTPAANYNGADSFTYTINDGNGASVEGTVNITVNPVNDTPVANNDSVEINEDTNVLVDVTANDTDIDGDALTVTGYTQGSYGTVSQEGNSLRYTPAVNYNGADSFMYEINDGNGGVRTATVNITVNAVNDAPTAVTDTASLNEDSTVLIDVLVNDTDVEGDILSITSFTQGSHGTVAQEGGSLRYTPAANYNGADSFTYTISDGKGTSIEGTSIEGTVNITVNPVNDTPVANNDSVETNENTNVLVDVTANDTDIDGDALTVTGYTQGSRGTVVQEGNSLRYTPQANYNGADCFMYEINDGNGGVRTATVNITINAVNDAPVSTDDTAELDANTNILIDVLANDTDVEGDTISIVSFTQGANGTVAQEGDSLRYTPNADYFGNDSFTYEISDGNGGISTATVSITVNQGALISMDITEPSGTTDFIELKITTAGNYFIQTSFYIKEIDTYVILYDSNKSQIAINDDYVSLYGALMANLNPGTYYIKVGEYFGGTLYCHLEVTRQ